MWTVLEARKAERGIDGLPRHVLEKYELWKSVVQVSGPEGLRRFPGFHDHVLKGKWKGHRSSYLTDSYRVVYWIDSRATRIHVMGVTHHDYRRK